MKKSNKNNICGLSERHVAQIIRRKMTEKIIPSKKDKKYKREKFRDLDYNNAT